MRIARSCLAALSLLMLCGCFALQSSFDDFTEDVRSSFANLDAELQSTRAQQAEVQAGLATQVAAIVDQKTQNLISDDEAKAQFAAAAATAKAEVERLEKERLDKLERETEKMALQAELRKRESAEQQKQLVSELVSSGVGLALQSPATAKAIQSVIEGAYGEPVSRDDLTKVVADSVKELKGDDGVTEGELYATAGGISGALVLALQAYRSATRRREMEKLKRETSQA